MKNKKKKEKNETLAFSFFFKKNLIFHIGINAEPGSPRDYLIPYLTKKWTEKDSFKDKEMKPCSLYWRVPKETWTINKEHLKRQNSSRTLIIYLPQHARRLVAALQLDQPWCALEFSSGADVPIVQSTTTLYQLWRSLPFFPVCVYFITPFVVCRRRRILIVMKIQMMDWNLEMRQR